MQAASSNAGGVSLGSRRSFDLPVFLPNASWLCIWNSTLGIVRAPRDLIKPTGDSVTKFWRYSDDTVENLDSSNTKLVIGVRDVRLSDIIWFKSGHIEVHLYFLSWLMFCLPDVSPTLNYVATFLARSTTLVDLLQSEASSSSLQASASAFASCTSRSLSCKACSIS